MSDDTIYVHKHRDLIFCYLLNGRNVLRNPKSKLEITILDIFAGDDERFVFQAALLDGTPVDLTGTITFTAKLREQDVDPLLTFDIAEVDDAENDFTNGIFVLNLTAVETMELPSWSDFFISQDVSGVITTLVAGEIHNIVTVGG